MPTHAPSPYPFDREIGMRWAMTSAHSSFLMRCRRVSGGEARIDIEHIQAGERARVASLAAALAWIGARWEAAGAAAGQGSREPPAPGTGRETGPASE